MLVRMMSLVVATFIGVGVAVGQSQAKPLTVDPALVRSIDQILKDVSSIQPGMTRADLLRVFMPEAGLSTRDGQEFEYRRCPYVKVIVNFHKPDDADVDWGSAPEEEWSHDLILSISKPFLESSAPE